MTHIPSLRKHSRLATSYSSSYVYVFYFIMLLATIPLSSALTIDPKKSLVVCPRSTSATDELKCQITVVDTGGKLVGSKDSTCHVHLAVCPPGTAYDPVASYIPTTSSTVKFKTIGHFEVSLPMRMTGVNRVYVRYDNVLLGLKASNVTVTPGTIDHSRTESHCNALDLLGGKSVCVVSRYDGYGNLINACEQIFDHKYGVAYPGKCN
eukprot:PhF_6_TR10440/c0_g2_i1/m.16511